MAHHNDADKCPIIATILAYPEEFGELLHVDKDTPGGYKIGPLALAEVIGANDTDRAPRYTQWSGVLRPFPSEMPSSIPSEQPCMPDMPVLGIRVFTDSAPDGLESGPAAGSDVHIDDNTGNTSGSYKLGVYFSQDFSQGMEVPQDVNDTIRQLLGTTALAGSVPSLFVLSEGPGLEPFKSDRPIVTGTIGSSMTTTRHAAVRAAEVLQRTLAAVRKLPNTEESATTTAPTIVAGLQKGIPPVEDSNSGPLPGTPPTPVS